MEKLNGLPGSWAVRNDGSEGFVVVLDYLNEWNNGEGKFVGNDVGCYYGISNGKVFAHRKGKPVVSSNTDHFDVVLTLDEFVVITAPKVGRKSVRVESIGFSRGCVGDREIRISLELARRMYNDVNLPIYLGELVTSNFTEEELNPKKGFSWEESFGNKGYYISNCAEVVSYEPEYSVKGFNKNLFKTESQARSALAFAQLSHIVAKYNEGKKSVSDAWTISSTNSVCGNLFVRQFGFTGHLPHLVFFTREDAETSRVVNRALWEQYWMV